MCTVPTSGGKALFRPFVGDLCCNLIDGFLHTRPMIVVRPAADKALGHTVVSILLSNRSQAICLQ
jgi:hypothetical protein